MEAATIFSCWRVETEDFLYIIEDLEDWLEVTLEVMS